MNTSYQTETLESLFENGWAVVNDFFSMDEVTEQKNKIDSWVKSPPSDIRHNKQEAQDALISDAHSFQKSSSVFLGKHTSELELFFEKIYQSEELREVALKYLGKEVVYGARLQCIRSVHLENLPTAIPYVPHFDRVHCFKYYFYLCDVEKTGGHLFMGAKNGCEISRNIRTPLVEANVRWQSIPGHDITKHSPIFEPVNAKPGDLIIFDSNQPHFHSPVKKSQQRYVGIFESSTFDEIKFAYNKKLGFSIDSYLNGNTKIT